MAKDLSVTILLDVYGQLLTEKQRFAIDMYYNEDLSLAEIAEQIDISRQGVRDSIKKGEEHLWNFEEQLGVVKRFQNISTQLKKMNEVLEKLEFDGKEKLLEISAEISQEIYNSTERSQIIWHLKAWATSCRVFSKSCVVRVSLVKKILKTPCVKLSWLFWKRM